MNPNEAVGNPILGRLHPPYQLGLANRARNLEFDRVLLTPNLMVPSEKIKSAKKQVQVLSAIYIGASRAKHELIIPAHLQDWLEGQQVQTSRESDGDGFD